MTILPEQTSDTIPADLENHFLLFKTYHGALMGWCILTDLPSEEIDSHIESAAHEWLLTEDGKGYVQKENLNEWGVDFANVMMNIPPDLLAKYRIFPGAPVYEIIELDPEENLLPDELRAA